MKRCNLLFIVLFISILAQSCRQDVDIIDIYPPEIVPVIKVLASIQGKVTDDKGNIVSGALVTLENESVETDENGVFQFINMRMNKNGAYITIKKDGYFNGSRRMYPSKGATSLVNIELLTLEIAGEFNSNTQSTIIHKGVFLEFPENAVVDEDGTDHNGMVRVAVAYLDPTDVNTLDQMPGDLSGISTNGDLVALKSLGMFAVELMDDSGNQLQIKAGHAVDVLIPIPSELQEAAPSSIPMWHFDEETGIWKEEGFADLVGENYETSLSHFSFWNCDIPIDYVFMKGSILNREIPIQGITVVIEDLNNNTSGYGVTDENGMFCGYIPGGEELVLTVFNQCGEVIYTTTIGDFDEDVILDPIDLNLIVDFVTLSGIASFCDIGLSEYAYIKVEQGAENYTFPILEDDTFQGNMFYCNEGESIILSAFDPVAGISSGEFSYTVTGDLDVGNIELCEEELIEHIILEYGDVKWNIPFDENLLTTLVYKNENVLTGEDDTHGFIFDGGLIVGLDSVLSFRFFVNYVEGFSTQQCQVQPSPGGFWATGACSSQVVAQDGIEYFLATGTVPVSHITNSGTYDPSYTSAYFHLLVEK